MDDRTPDEELDDSAIEGRLGRLGQQVDVPAAPPLGEIKVGRSPRRTAAIALVAAIVVLVAGIGITVAASRQDDGTGAIQTGPADGGSDAAQASDAELARLLEQVGVDLDAAPPGTLDTMGAQVCGVIENLNGTIAGGGPPEEAKVPGRCFLDAHLAQLPAIVVLTSTTVEGQPIVEILRTRGDGTVDGITDTTQDSYSSQGWYIEECDGLTTGVPSPTGTESPETSFQPTACRPLPPSAGVTPIATKPLTEAPAWFTDRAVLPLCDVEIHMTESFPSRRQCFADAVTQNQPAELAYVSYGDEGATTARWFRSLGDGTYELMERWHDERRSSGTSGWTRSTCGSIEITHEPGAYSDLLPTDANATCTVVDNVIDPMNLPADPSASETTVTEPASDAAYRVLGDGLVGSMYVTGIATNAEQYTQLWARSGLQNDAPPVDFEDEVVVWLGKVYGSGCAVDLTDITIDPVQALIYGDWGWSDGYPSGPRECLSDANPHSYVVAIRRDSLPAGPFAIQLTSQDPPAGAPDERTLVDADLSIPGSIATDEQIGPDPSYVQGDGN